MKIQRRLILGVASLAALHSGYGLALGLGDLHLQSALNQPLAATIELRDVAGIGPGDIRASLASAEAFERAGIERPFFLTDLRFVSTVIDSRLVIRVESSRPVREPYLNFLVQLDRPDGALLREYTVLLDPPLYAPSPVTIDSVAAPRAAVQSAAAPVPAPARAPAREVAPAAVAPEAGSERYRTRPGDSLWSIARTTRSSEAVSLQQQMDAILALNPQAFVNGDPTRLRSDQVLTLPAGSREYRARVATAVAEPAPSAPAAAPASERVAGDRLRIEEPSPLPVDVELEERLHSLELRFHGLMTELEKRDAQIARLQAELEQRNLHRDNGKEVAQPASAAQSGLSGTAGEAQPLTANAGAEPLSGAIESTTAPAEELESAAPQDQLAAQEQAEESGWLARWWPLPTSLLAVLAGVWMLRPRREQEHEQPEALAEPALQPVHQPIIVPGSREVDPLTGVDLYLTYGRFADARIMLERAIADEPERLELRLRMLRVLAELGEGAAFAEQEQVALELGGDADRIAQLKARYPQLQPA